jgi:glycogen operon protein
MLIDGQATDETDARGRPVKGDTLLLLLNGGAGRVAFHLPQRSTPGGWMELVDTASAPSGAVRAQSVRLEAHSLVLLRYAPERRRREEPREPDAR